uniref:Uncharacterized protein n=1 Tax=Romanomermis culicivorax TaxID=13658 RepID=A0A915JHE1_ROMCU
MGRNAVVEKKQIYWVPTSNFAVSKTKIEWFGRSRHQHIWLSLIHEDRASHGPDFNFGCIQEAAGFSDGKGRLLDVCELLGLKLVRNSVNNLVDWLDCLDIVGDSCGRSAKLVEGIAYF